MHIPIFISYTSPNDGGNDIEDDHKPMVQRAIDKLKEVVVQLKTAIDGDEVIDNNFGSGDSEGSSGSGSGSGDEESSGENTIPDNVDKPTTDSENEIDENDDNENAFAGGVAKPSPGSRGNSSSRHHVGVWLFVSTLWVLLATLAA